MKKSSEQLWIEECASMLRESTLNESVVDLSRDQIKAETKKIGTSLAKYVSDSFLGEIRKKLDLDDTDMWYSMFSRDDAEIKDLIEAIPVKVRNQVFELISDKELTEFKRTITKLDNEEQIDTSFDISENDTNDTVRDILLREVFSNALAFQLELGTEPREYDFNEYDNDTQFGENFRMVEDHYHYLVVDKIATFLYWLTDALGMIFAERLNHLNDMKTFKVTTQWLIPEFRSEKVKARSKEDLEEILAEKYRHYMNSHSEDQELYNGIWDSVEIKN